MKINFLILGLLLTAMTAYSQTADSKRFLDVFKDLKTSKNQPFKCDYKDDEIQKRILFEYGAVYVSKGAMLPKNCRFESDTEIDEFANRFKSSSNKFNFGEFYLQSTAKRSLENVFKTLGGYEYVARNCNDRNEIPCDKTSAKIKLNNDWGLRSFTETAMNWHLDLTKNKNDQNKSIIKSFADIGERPKMSKVAIPGGSQHHLGLAIDVNDEEPNLCKKDCVAVLEKNGWYRTIPFDSYHFTFLGFLEFELPDKGLKKVKCSEFTYWIPYLSTQDYPGFKYTKENCPDVK